MVQAERMSNHRSLLPVDDYSALLNGLQKEHNPWFAEVASFIINSDNGDIERDAKSVVDAYNKLMEYINLTSTTQKVAFSVT